MIRMRKCIFDDQDGYRCHYGRKQGIRVMVGCYDQWGRFKRIGRDRRFLILCARHRRMLPNGRYPGDGYFSEYEARNRRDPRCEFDGLPGFTCAYFSRTQTKRRGWLKRDVVRVGVRHGGIVPTNSHRLMCVRHYMVWMRYKSNADLSDKAIIIRRHDMSAAWAKRRSKVECKLANLPGFTCAWGNRDSYKRGWCPRHYRIRKSLMRGHKRVTLRSLTDYASKKRINDAATNASQTFAKYRRSLGGCKFAGRDGYRCVNYRCQHKTYGWCHRHKFLARRLVCKGEYPAVDYIPDYEFTEVSYRERLVWRGVMNKQRAK